MENAPTVLVIIVIVQIVIVKLDVTLSEIPVFGILLEVTNLS